MDWLKIPLREIMPSSRNLRERLDGIDELAASIEKEGLLQNLVVERRSFPAGYEVCAGNRRLKALKLLVKNGKIPEDFEVPCLVRWDGDSDEFYWTNTIENLQRQDVPIWEYGARFNELKDAGYSGNEIAARIQRNAGYVSRASHIASLIHPEVLSKVKELRGKRLSDSQLLQISHILNRDGTPDLKGQMVQFKLYSRKRLPTTKGQKGSHSRETYVMRRLKKIKDGSSFKVPGYAVPVIKAVVDYLEGRSTTIQIESFNDIKFY